LTILLVCDCGAGLNIILGHSQCDILLCYTYQNNHNVTEEVVFVVSSID